MPKKSKSLSDRLTFRKLQFKKIGDISLFSNYWDFVQSVGFPFFIVLEYILLKMLSIRLIVASILFLFC